MAATEARVRARATPAMAPPDAPRNEMTSASTTHSRTRSDSAGAQCPTDCHLPTAAEPFGEEKPQHVGASNQKDRANKHQKQSGENRRLGSVLRLEPCQSFPIHTDAPAGIRSGMIAFQPPCNRIYRGTRLIERDSRLQSSDHADRKHITVGESCLRLEQLERHIQFGR